MTDTADHLPKEYLERMSLLLGDEYEAFLDSYNKPRTYGLRINPLKVDLEGESILSILSHPGTDIDPESRISWCKEGYYYNEDSCPGRSPYHEAGAYYIQEPSAMAVTTVLDPKPGERICDLCAAPGGKTTHIAGRMQGKGVLIANEFVSERAGVLSRNVERMGVSNCIVTSMDPRELSNRFMGYFDKVCVDAPCSGEGMFRKDPEACSQWSVENVSMCSDRQKMILNAAADMVIPGGVIVYSTCTFETEENENVIESFLTTHPDWEIGDTDLGIKHNGRLEQTTRIWPHREKGEGHFIAKLVRTGTSDKNARNADLKNKNRQLRVEVSRFLHTELDYDIPENRCLTENKDHVYMLPEGIDESMIKGIKVIRPGLELVTRHKDRFEPAHALAMSLRPDEVHGSCEIGYENAVKYLKGETLNVKSEINISTYTEKRTGWFLITIDGVSLGWGKVVGEIIKNHYPKGLRRDTGIGSTPK